MSVAIPQFMKKIQFSGAAPPLILAMSRHYSQEDTKIVAKSVSRENKFLVYHTKPWVQKTDVASPAQQNNSPTSNSILWTHTVCYLICCKPTGIRDMSHCN
jgi:hypothetical protein